MAEDLTDYLSEHGGARALSTLDTIERVQIISAICERRFDVLVGSSPRAAFVCHIRVLHPVANVLYFFARLGN